jgi:hypothetical protein
LLSNESDGKCRELIQAGCRSVTSPGKEPISATVHPFGAHAPSVVGKKQSLPDMKITTTDVLLIIAVILVFIVGPFWLIYKLDKHVAKKGTLFTGKPTGGVKLFAIVLGIIFAGIFIFLLFYIHDVSFFAFQFLVLAIALMGYGLGFGRLLNKFQNKGNNTKSIVQTPENAEAVIENLNRGDMGLIPKNRFLRLFTAAAIFLLFLFIYFYAVWWLISTYPDSPFTSILVVGIFVLLASSRWLIPWFIRFFK